MTSSVATHFASRCHLGRASEQAAGFAVNTKVPRSSLLLWTRQFEIKTAGDSTHMKALKEAGFRALALSFIASGMVMCFEAQAAQTDPALSNVIDLASRRIALAEPAARAKWARQEPVVDPVHEQASLTRLTQRAPENGVNVDFARQFFGDQLDAVNSVENALYAQWRTAPPQDPVPDLATTVRPEQERIEHAMLMALARVQVMRTAPDCGARLAQSLANWKTTAAVNSERAAALDIALAHVCAAGPG